LGHAGLLSGKARGELLGRDFISEYSFCSWFKAFGSFGLGDREFTDSVCEIGIEKKRDLKSGRH
jgi:hypothetical protein